ncbi:MAG: histidine phosphatase family protein [Planctomycetia bacterium]
MAKKKPAKKNTTAKVVLIKPGSTDYDEQGRIQGNLDIPLNSQGAGEVEKIAEFLEANNIDTVYCPPCEPALETAKALAKSLGTKVKKLGKMENVDLGLWQGMKTDEVRRKQQRVYRQWQEHPETVCPPEGETLDDARGRMEAVLAKTLKRHNEETIGLVVPEPMASLVRQFLLGNATELGDLWVASAERPKCEFFEVEVISKENKAEEELATPLNGGGKGGKSNGVIVKPVTVISESS